MVKRYDQYCGLARALDLVGARWGLLIVRELLLSPKRFGELMEGLPGIPTNLLTERLREFEQNGLIERGLDSGSNKAVYSLTPWGAALREPIESLIRWSTPTMISGPGTDAFRDPWLELAVGALMAGRRSEHPATVGFDTGDAYLTVSVEPSGAEVRMADERPAGTVLRTVPQVVLGLATRLLPAREAVSMGELEGSVEDLEAVFEVTPGPL